MNALQSYSSDDESGGEAPALKTRKSGDPGTNYDDVGMDISEDSDEELPSAHQARERAGATRPTGNSTTKHQESSSTSRSSEDLSVTSSEGGKNPSESKEGHRSSLQERLLGLASGASQRTLPGEDRGGARDRREKSRSKSREREVGRSSQSNRDHSSRSHQAREQTAQGHSGRGRDCRKGREDDRKRKDDDRRGRRSRSRSRSRDRRRSRSRSRERRSRSRSRSRSRERRRRSRSRERKRPMDIRKEAQQKLAALKAANPDLTAAELLKRSMEAQVVEVQKQTGITLPSYYNPAAMNPMKFAEQERKKKLLWGNKNKTPPTPTPAPQANPTENPRPMNTGFGGMNFGPRFPTMPISRAPQTPTTPTTQAGASGSSGGQAALWANTRFSNDRDGKMAEKFRRLMGVKDQEGPIRNMIPAATGLIMVQDSEIGEAAPSSSTKEGTGGNGSKDKGIDILQKQETMFSSMERQYEMARIATHTHKGFGLGFTSQSFIPK
ncbi:arginine/serine-rich coiled-coil protein 2-like isoform X2 [Eriocheir sinensis]|uniref:arginine/serine-rich coiled-coil protein 2-like isoform X2 n=1 Tax=Eriocheir sinensis TaxID=95602 RepID=UPI0021CA8D47|nr:arginine/serine-rich coiled-coil protein 2-like isoform X2 [Eriocheir sinensis]